MPTLDELAGQIEEWFKEVILPESNPHATLLKTAEEFQELREEENLLHMADKGRINLDAHEFNIVRARMEMEAADTFIGFVAWCSAEGIDLRNAVHIKHNINKKRRWGPPDKDGVRRHI